MYVIHTYVYIYIYMYVHAFLYVYVYIYIYTPRPKSPYPVPPKMICLNVCCTCALDLVFFLFAIDCLYIVSCAVGPFRKSNEAHPVAAEDSCALADDRGPELHKCNKILPAPYVQWAISYLGSDVEIGPMLHVGLELYRLCSLEQIRQF